MRRIRHFSNLFVETEFVAELGALLATRRKRSPEESSIWAGARAWSWKAKLSANSSMKPIARDLSAARRHLRNPVSVIDGRPLYNTVGSVLDPVMSLRRTCPHSGRAKPLELIFSTIVAATREDVLNLADKYRDARTFERTLTLAWTQSQVQLRHLGISADEAQLFQRLANAVLYSDAALRPNAAVLAATPLEKAALWSQGISGDLPIVLARIDDADDFEMIRQLLRAHEYWRMKQLSADVVIINEKATSYIQDLQGSLEALVRGSQLRLSPDTQRVSGKIFLLRADLISPQTSAQLQAIARVVLLSRRGTLAEQNSRERSRKNRPRRFCQNPPAPPGRPPRRHLHCSRLYSISTAWAASARTAANTSSLSSEGSADSGAVDQRNRQSGLRFPRLGIRLGLHLVAEQPRESDHAVVERPRHRSAGRGHLSTR